MVEVKPKKVSNIEVITEHKLDNVLVVDFLPIDRELRRQFKYYCPICLRYFNFMLVSSCCNNYLCHYCADEMAERERNVDSFQGVCPLKCEGKFILRDVDPKDQPKKYSDSQCMSSYSNNLGKLTAQNGFGLNSKSKLLNKENLSPGDMVTPYDPFGDQEYKTRYFQHSANHFMVKRQDLNTSDEESKHRVGPRSDAFHGLQMMAADDHKRAPFGNLRQNMIRQANMPAVFSDGFAVNRAGNRSI